MNLKWSGTIRNGPPTAAGRLDGGAPEGAEAPAAEGGGGLIATAAPTASVRDALGDLLTSDEDGEEVSTLFAGELSAAAASAISGVVSCSLEIRASAGRP